MITGYVIWMEGTASGIPTDFDRQYVVDYDPDGHGGMGAIVSSHDRANAKRFRDLADAITFYRQVSKRRPRRSDGRPNRPLTAMTVKFEPLAD